MKRILAKRILAAAVMAASFPPLGVLAQERAGEAALGALSGAIILGPVGAVAGAVVGYTAGPSIARSWGLGRSEPRHQRRFVKRSAQAASKQSTQGASPQGAAAKNSAPPTNPSAQSTRTRNAMPPIQALE